MSIQTPCLAFTKILQRVQRIDSNQRSDNQVVLKMQLQVFFPCFGTSKSGKEKRLSPNGERHHIRINLVLYGWRRDKANISFNIYYIVICWLYDCWLEINIFFSQVQSREIMKNRIVFSTKQFIVKEKDFTRLTCFSRLGPSCYSCYSSIILIFIISKIFETNPRSIYLSLSMRGNI